MLNYIDVETSLAVGFYLVLSLWWFVSVTTKYASCIRGNTDFHSRVTYPCCGSLRKWPVEGVVKFISGSLIAVLSAIKCYKNCDDNRKLGEVTVFVIIAISGLCDIITQKCQRYVFSNTDYFVLMFAFLLQAIVSASHVELVTSSLAIADECTMFAAASVAVAVLLEFKFDNVIWFSLLRSFSTLLLGTWNFHVAVILSNETFHNHNMFNLNVSKVEALSAISRNITESEKIQVYKPVDDGAILLLVPMYFAWHCFLDMFILTILWLIIYRCSSRHFCSTLDEENESHFEHHIHFDYHIIDRLDSDLE